MSVIGMNSNLWGRHSLVLGVSIVLFCFWSAQSRFMPAAEDAISFVPTAQSLIRGEGWVNTMYLPPVPVEPAHPERAVWHGVVAQVLWAAIARSDDFGDIRMAGILVSSIGCLIFGLLLLRVTRDLRWPASSALTVTGMLGTCGYFGHNGRPESVACALVCAGLWVLLKGNSRWWTGLCGCFLGLIAATSPISALSLVPLVCIHQLVSCPNILQVCRRVAVIGVCTVLVMLAVVLAVAIDPMLWFEAMRLHSSKVLWGRSEGNFAYYWIKDARVPLLLVRVAAHAACLAAGLRFWLQRLGWSRLTLFHRAALGCCAAALLWVIWATSIKVIAAKYNLMSLLVVAALMAVSIACASMGRQRTALMALLYISFAPGVLGLCREVAVWNAGKDHVLMRSQAIDMLLGDLHEMGVSQQDVCVDTGLFELAGGTEVSGRKFHVLDAYSPDAGGATGNVFVMNQAHSRLLEPPDLKEFGFRLAVNRFDTKLPRILGMKIANTPGGYNYAIYVRDRSGGA